MQRRRMTQSRRKTMTLLLQPAEGGPLSEQPGTEGVAAESSQNVPACMVCSSCGRYVWIEHGKDFTYPSSILAAEQSASMSITKDGCFGTTLVIDGNCKLFWLTSQILGDIFEVYWSSAAPAGHVHIPQETPTSFQNEDHTKQLLSISLARKHSHPGSLYRTCSSSPIPHHPIEQCTKNLKMGQK